MRKNTKSIILLSLFSLFSASGALAETDTQFGLCDSINIKHTTSPTAPIRWTYRETTQEIMPTQESSEPILFVGDSLVDRLPQDLANTAFGEGNVKLLGVSGDRTQTTLARLESMDLSLLSPDLVILLLGTNNISDRDPACAIAAGLEKNMDVMADAWPDVQFAMIDIPPRGLGFSEHLEVRQEIRALISEHSHHQPTILDFNDAMSCGAPAPFPPSYFEFYDDGYREGRPDSPCANYRNDLLHFSDEGYHVLTSELAPVIQNFLKDGSLAIENPDIEVDQ